MVKFETITGREINLTDLGPDPTIGEAKALLAAQYDWELQKIHLLFDGSEQQDNTKLSKINLEGGKRFIVIYVEPTGKAPDVEDMINRLIDYNPDRQKCLEALQNNSYNIDLASEYLLNHIIDSSPEPTTNSNNNRSNNLNTSSNRTASIPQNGKQVQPDPNPWHYTPPQQKTNEYGLTEDEVKTVQEMKPKEWDDEVTFDLFISAKKDVKAFQKIINSMME